ncbi:autotransporter domain-containing protein [Lignipirellula cremea]|uniref:Autotransporter domain-containing protein n=1 Tax=Lignipirellula cremea TaxID=2528010 RepID=A0A518DYA7_9BACT|nr:autotransporter domain-containing protein [Lignipirellula cremea]QDU96828.1 hypothetical protein Pla8534_46500 [Lignipirellula cremea]
MKQFPSHYLLSLVGYGRQQYETRRAIPAGPAAQTAEARYGANQFHTYLEAGTTLEGAHWNATPYAGLQ